MMQVERIHHRMTIAEKIIAKKSGRNCVKPGEIVEVTPDVVMSHYTTYRVINVLKRLGVETLWNKNMIKIVLDHYAPPKNKEHANHERMARDFAQAQGLTFYDIHEGIAHVVLLEKGEILPEMLVVGTDSHSTIYGSVGAFGTGIGFTEAASIWLTGKLWLKVPESFKISIRGNVLPFGVYPKDLILTLIGQLTANGCTYRSVEFYGDLISNMEMPGRMTLSCMSMEMGVKAAIFPVDKITTDYLLHRFGGSPEMVNADPGAHYAKELTFDADHLEPVVSLPHHVDNVVPISDLEPIQIHQAFVGSCSNGSREDLGIVAQILKGRKIAPGTRLIVTPASREVLKEVMMSGDAYHITESGAMITNPGCSVCVEDGGSLGDGENCLSSSTRNFLGRMGNANSNIFLASPATVASSALKGVITDPRDFL